MDFELDQDLQEVRDLARQVLAAEATTDRVREVEQTGTRVDQRLWSTLGSTGLVGIGLPEDLGGAGLGLGALAVVLQEQGRAVAPVPLWSHGVGAHLIVTYAAPDLAAALVPPLATGERRVGVALEEHDGREPAEPAAVAVAEGDSWLLTGTKALVPTAAGLDHVIVSAATESGPGLFLLDADAAGLTWDQASVTTHDLAADLHLDGAAATALGRPGDDALPTALGVAAAALAALQVGVCEGALDLAASYLSEREQFGRPLGSFQAVQHQLADCWIDIQAMTVTLWQALSDLEDADGAAARSALVAKWWCDQAGLDVVHRVQHVHGGMGVDTDYPVHRHFLWGKQLANTLGGAEAALAGLGAALADEAPADEEAAR